MAAISSLSISTRLPAACNSASSSEARSSGNCSSLKWMGNERVVATRISSSGRRLHCGARGVLSARTARVVCAVAAATEAPPTVADTKAGFLNRYRKPIPNIYNSVIQELLVQHHLVRYNSSYHYDPIFALGFVTVYDQLMDGFPSTEDRDKIFKAYVEALNEDPVAYRKDSQQLEEWASKLGPSSLADFASKDGPVEAILKDISERAGGGKTSGFHYSRFFAIGLFRLMDLSGASDPATLEKLCAALGVNKMSVDRDLDVYRGLLNKLTQAKEPVQEFLKREKAKQEEREKEKEKA